MITSTSSCRSASRCKGDGPQDSLRLVRLELRNYRNYPRLELVPSPEVNVFLGRNGQGKTNLLEAVAILALSSSPRARRESDLVGPLASDTRIQATVDTGEGSSQIEVALSGGERTSRTIKVDGRPRRAVDLPGVFRVTLFWPEDLNLVKSGPEYRRRFLNHMLVQVERDYARNLARYTRALEQRNHLLKQIASGEQPASALEPWDAQLAPLGSAIAGARRAAVGELQELARGRHETIAPGETLQLEYLGQASDLGLALQESLREDLRRGTTSVGPHRDDVAVLLNGRDARSFASQGQQRTAVVSLKLAEASLVETRTGDSPVLLLDDVLSELDLDRRGALLHQVSGRGQVIITSVDAAPFPQNLMSQALVRCITAGRVQDCD